jgi:hypothetical protein
LEKSEERKKIFVIGRIWDIEKMEKSKRESGRIWFV